MNEVGSGECAMLGSFYITLLRKQLSCLVHQDKLIPFKCFTVLARSLCTRTLRPVVVCVVCTALSVGLMCQPSAFVARQVLDAPRKPEKFSSPIRGSLISLF